MPNGELYQLNPDSEMPAYLPMEETGTIVITTHVPKNGRVIKFEDLKSWSLWHGFLVLNYTKPELARVLIPRETISSIEIRPFPIVMTTAEARAKVTPGRVVDTIHGSDT